MFCLYIRHNGCVFAIRDTHFYKNKVESKFCFKWDSNIIKDFFPGSQLTTSIFP